MSIVALTPPPQELARRARLRYTCDEDHGIHRVMHGRRVVYEDCQGRPVRDPRQLERIRTLAIPPAWTNVWICSHPSGHLQATGRDARGRKQYIYHEQWQAHTSRSKFNKLRRFGAVLPIVRQRVSRDMSLPALPKRKVVATVIALLDRTCIRVGNDEYAKANGSYGLTTLQDQHAEIHGPTIHLEFVAKSGKYKQVDFRDKRVARIVRECQELPGQRLFQYSDNTGRLRHLGSADVNRYLQTLTGHAFTAKDFRTWKGSAFMLERLLAASAEPQSLTAAKRTVAKAFREVAEELGNTISVCRKYYVHPDIVELFLNGKLAAACGRGLPRATSRMSIHERLLLRLLQRLELRPASGAATGGMRFATKPR